VELNPFTIAGCLLRYLRKKVEDLVTKAETIRFKEDPQNSRKK
jgi:hypothetical protein